MIQLMDRPTKEKILATAKAELLRDSWGTFVDDPHLGPILPEPRCQASDSLVVWNEKPKVRINGVTVYLTTPRGMASIVSAIAD
jgi:hypothetical protein